MREHRSLRTTKPFCSLNISIDHRVKPGGDEVWVLMSGENMNFCGR